MPARTPAELFKHWLGPSMVVLLAIRVAWYFLQSDAVLPTRSSSSSGVTKGVQVYYFYNEATGQVQWEDPGDVPYEDAAGARFWVLGDGSKVLQDPSAGKYAWVEQYSPDLNRAYFFNLETKESTWERPPDLAWRRIPVVEHE